MGAINMSLLRCRAANLIWMPRLSQRFESALVCLRGEAHEVCDSPLRGLFAASCENLPRETRWPSSAGLVRCRP